MKKILGVLCILVLASLLIVPTALEIGIVGALIVWGGCLLLAAIIVAMVMFIMWCFED